VSFMWDRVGEIGYPLAAGSEDKVMEAAIEAGGEDVETDEDGHTIYTAFADLAEVAGALEAALGAPKSTNIVWRPKARTPITGDAAGSLMKLLETLDDDDDVQKVYSNEEIDAAELESLAG
jgi:transcriptional/translational regulatory protein YebC/TACO1